MKLLLDECVVQDFRHAIVGHDVRTVAYMGWDGVQNGQLLARAAADGFDALVTTDKSLAFQQNLHSLPMAVVVLYPTTQDLSGLAALAPRLIAALQSLTPRAVTVVAP
jgi:hypothetical protein